MVGAGQGLIMTPSLNLVLGFVDESTSGMASGIVSTVQQVGAALGVAVVGILFKAVLSGTHAAPDAGLYASAFVAGMLYNLGAAVLIWLLLLRLSKTQRMPR
jgi:predicted membrane-bound spermidine synthase